MKPIPAITILIILIAYLIIYPEKQRPTNTQEQINQSNNITLIANYRHRWDITEYTNSKVTGLSNPYVQEQTNIITLDNNKSLITWISFNPNDPWIIDDIKFPYHNNDTITKTVSIPYKLALYHIIDMYNQTDSTQSFNAISRKGHQYQVEFDYKNQYVIFRYLDENESLKPYKVVLDIMHITVK